MAEHQNPPTPPQLDRDSSFIVTVDKDKREICMLFHDPLLGLKFTVEGALKLAETLTAYAESLGGLEERIIN